MSVTNKVVNVKLLGKEYKVVCPNDKQHELSDAAVFLSEKMNEIKKSGRVIGVERIAIMAALNVAYELLESKKSYEAEKANLNTKLEEFSFKLSDGLSVVNKEFEAELL